MAESSNSAGRRRARTVSSVGVSIALLVVGAVIDICGVVNVPGGAVFPTVDGATVKVTGLGTLLALLAIGAWVTVLWRRRYPLIVLIAGTVVAAIGLSYLLLLVGAVAFVRRRPELSARVGGIVGAAVVLFAIREAVGPWGAALPWFLTTRPSALSEPGWVIASFVVAAVSLGIAMGAVLISRTRNRAEQSEQQAAALARRADVLAEQAVRQAERERIARDMHDALAHRLSVVSLHAGALEAAASAQGDAGQGATGDMARTVREQTHAALQDMRGLIGELRSAPDAAPAAPASMRACGALVAGLRAAGHSITSLIVVESPERAGALFDGAVYRIVQEALTNAIKHAPGATVDLIVQVAPGDGARIRVVNPLSGRITPAVPGGGNGVLGIRERASALGGRVWVGPHQGSFIVDVSLPWQERG
ncbi:sensor histidine kinase [Microbacterium sp. 179-I 3D4 NHS]|uniref:sensor histidine kinase n=1 Tax=Microbacterium sp. 179-I 3D4 NHS TaxID=3142381 RepID=UPI0039A2E7A6